MCGKKNITNEMRAFVIRHLAAISLIFVVASLFGSGHFFAARLIPNDTTYHPVTEMIDFDEGADYAVRAAATFYRNDLLVGDVSLKENFSGPAFLPILNPLIVAGFGKAANSLDGGFILAEIILPTLSFFLIYLLGFEILCSRLAAILLAVVFLFAPRFALFPSVDSLSFGTNNQLYFARFEYPMVTFPFFVAALYLIARVLKRNEKWLFLAAGAAVGLLFYTYLYDWIYVLAGLFVLIIFFLIMGERKGIIKILKIVLVTGVVSIPYGFNFFAIKSLAGFNDLIVRMGVEFSHKIRLDIVWFSYVRAVVLAALVWFVNRKKQSTTAAYVAAFILPILFLLNIQVLTGFIPQPDHWHRVTFLMLAVAVFAIVLPFIVKIKIKLIFAVALVAFSTGWLFGYSFGVQYLRAPVVAEAAIIDHDYEEIYQWLLNKKPKSNILSLSPVTNSEAIIYSGVWTFLPNGFHTVISNEEISERAKISAAIYRLAPAAFGDFLKMNNQYLFVDFYRADKTFNNYFRSVGRIIPVEVLNNLIVDYEDDYLNIIDKLKFSEPIFVIFGPREKDFGANLPLAVSAKLVYSFGKVSIYEINDNQKKQTSDYNSSF